MNLLIIGGGGREHALAWKLSQSPTVTKIYCAPGNAGTAQLGENVPLAITDTVGLLDVRARDHEIGLTVVGPDDALAAGIVDVFQAAGLRIFGPTRARPPGSNGRRFSPRNFSCATASRPPRPAASSGARTPIISALERPIRSSSRPTDWPRARASSSPRTRPPPPQRFTR